MDINQLLDNTTPFTQNKLNILDTVTNILYTTANNNDVSLLFNVFRGKWQIKF